MSDNVKAEPLHKVGDTIKYRHFGSGLITGINEDSQEATVWFSTGKIRNIPLSALADNRDVPDKSKKEPGRPGLEFTSDAVKKKGYVTVDDVLADFKPVGGSTEETVAAAPEDSEQEEPEDDNEDNDYFRDGPDYDDDPDYG